MSIKKMLCRVGIVLAVAVTVAIGRDVPELRGTWYENGGSERTVEIIGDSAILKHVDDRRPVVRSAVRQKYWGIDQVHWRGIRSNPRSNPRSENGGSIKWVVFTTNPSKPNVATGSSWVEGEWTLSPDKQTLTVGDKNGSSTWQRRRPKR